MGASAREYEKDTQDRERRIGAPEKKRGLENRYDVTRLHDPDGKHDDCRYFVLDPLHDPLARVALRVYAEEAFESGFYGLSADLRAWLRDLCPDLRAVLDKHAGEQP